MGLSDSHPDRPCGYWFPHSSGFTYSNGSPRFLCTSFYARSPLSPRSALWLQMLISSPQVTGFIVSGSLAALIWCNEAESGSLSLGLTHSCSGVLPPSLSVKKNRPASCLRLPTSRGAPLYSERAITIAGSFHPARCTRLYPGAPKDTKSKTFGYNHPSCPSCSSW